MTFDHLFISVFGCTSGSPRVFLGGVTSAVVAAECSLEEHLTQAQESYRGLVQRALEMYLEDGAPDNYELEAVFNSFDLMKEHQKAIGCRRILTMPATLPLETRKEFVMDTASSALSWAFELYKAWREGRVSPEDEDYQGGKWREQ